MNGWPEDLDELERVLLTNVEALPAGECADGPLAPGSSLTAAALDAVFDAQLASRHLDHAARWLRARGLGFYTIGSAGHEANALVAAALRPTDPALLHYRSGGFYLARAQQVPGHDGVRDVLLGLLAAADEPIAGGRHKVFGHADLAVIPQTSTIASHLPRAMGVGFAIGRARRLGVTTRWPEDAIAVCSFGDASLNHSTAQGALNAAAYTAHQGMPMPVLFVCEDNGWGISVPTPSGWVAAVLRERPGLRYEYADGADPVAVFDAAEDLADHVRATGRPAVLHLRTVRYGGHAGTDVESSYRTAAGIRADHAGDPVLATARVLVAAGRLTPADVVERYVAGRARVRSLADELAGHRPLETLAEVVAPLAPHRPVAVADRAVRAAPNDARRAFFGRLPEDEGALTLAEAINRTLGDLLAGDPRLLVFGEDVAVKGGVYGVTRGLQRKAGAGRVFDTLLDEQSILGLGLGAGVSGLLPIPEIQYLAYLHNAEDQLRGEAASLAFFSNGQFTNPLVVRIAGYGYQQGFGGHFHNDNAVAVLRDIPGLVIASPGPGGGRRADAADVRGGGRRRRHRLRVPRTDRPVPHARPPRGRRRRVDRAVPAAGGVGGRARPHRRAGGRPRGRRRADRDVGQRPVPVAARGRPAGHRWHRLPRARPALARAAADRRRRRARRRARPCRRRRRDPPVRRRRRGGRQRPRRARLPRRAGAGGRP